jgi:putative transcriptional regulator
MIKFKVKVMLAMREMTQKELAERTGIRPPTVSAICTGTVKHLPIDALDKICEARELLSVGESADIVCFALEGALSSLEEIDARGISEQIVNQIFSRFCVGK